MANRRIEMYEYRQIIYRLRQGQSERSIARDGIASRTKVKQVRELAAAQGWLNEQTPLPEDSVLQGVCEQKPTI